MNRWRLKNTALLMCVVAALAIFPSSVDAQVKKRTHEITFDEMVPCVGEVVHLRGTISVSLTFAGKNLTDVDYSVEDIRGTGESTGRTYSPGRIKDHSQDYKVNNKGVGKGDVTLTFGIIGRSEANRGNDMFFLAKQIVGLDFRNTNKPPLIVDFEALKVCVTR